MRVLCVQVLRVEYNLHLSISKYHTIVEFVDSYTEQMNFKRSILSIVVSTSLTQIEKQIDFMLINYREKTEQKSLIFHHLMGSSHLSSVCIQKLTNYWNKCFSKIKNATINLNDKKHNSLN